MIETTEEMIEAFYLAGQDGPDVRAGLAAVLAIIERDYKVKQRSPRRLRPPGCLCAPTGLRYRLCPIHGIS